MMQKCKSENPNLTENGFIDQIKTMSVMLNSSEYYVLLADRHYRLIDLNDKAIESLGATRNFLAWKFFAELLSAKTAKKPLINESNFKKLPNSGKLIISANYDGNNLILNLQVDCGVMATELITKIFEPFFTTKSHSISLRLHKLRIKSQRINWNCLSVLTLLCLLRKYYSFN